MEITITRYQELVRKEIAFEMIWDFILRERGKELSDNAILDHITWLISTTKEEEKR